MEADGGRGREEDGDDFLGYLTLLDGHGRFFFSGVDPEGEVVPGGGAGNGGESKLWRRPP